MNKRRANDGTPVAFLHSTCVHVDHALPVYANKWAFSKPRLTSQMGQIFDSRAAAG
jgi:hypothetical protein